MIDLREIGRHNAACRVNGGGFRERAAGMKKCDTRVMGRLLPAGP